MLTRACSHASGSIEKKSREVHLSLSSTYCGSSREHKLEAEDQAGSQVGIRAEGSLLGNNDCIRVAHSKAAGDPLHSHSFASLASLASLALQDVLTRLMHMESLNLRIVIRKDYVLSHIAGGWKCA